MCPPNARVEPACVSYMASRWGTVVQEAKDQWYDAQSAVDCEQQLKWGSAFCCGDSPWPALCLRAGLGEPGHPYLLALCPLFPKKTPVLSLQVTVS